MKCIIRNRLPGVVGCFALAALWTFVASPDAAMAQGKGKPGGGGGGQTTFKVCVTFDNLSTDGVLSDDLLPSNSTSYCNKVDWVTAIVKDGFRLDTTRGPRALLIDFGAQSVPPELGNGVILAGVDMRIAKQYVADEFGNLILLDGERQSAGKRLDVGIMDVGEVARAALSIRFFFEDNNGNEQIWLLGYADIPGSGDGRICPSSAPVEVTRVSDTQWRIETVSVLDEPGGGSACLWGELAVLSGVFDMPFGITIDAL